MAIQNDEARRMLPIIVAAAKTHRLLNYQMMARELGRPKDNARMVAQVCDLLDAAAALAGVPLLALIVVRVASGEINPKAWAGSDAAHGRRQAIIDNSLAHQFTDKDFSAISVALDRLDGRSNIEAWKFVRATLTPAELDHNLQGSASPARAPLDAIDDLGSDRPARVAHTGLHYARDPRVRAAVMKRAGGVCEYCGEQGFRCPDGTRYLEAHHILALADEGEDRMTNVIAICPGEHREVHFGERRDEMERGMIAKVEAAELRRQTEPAN
jgi:5-methylcytosine-specific restriction endonuclease McrA